MDGRFDLDRLHLEWTEDLPRPGGFAHSPCEEVGSQRQVKGSEDHQRRAALGWFLMNSI